MRIRLLFLLLFCARGALTAQRPDSGTVDVTVRESMGMQGGFLIRSSGRSATTDAAGKAQLVLPAGNRLISVTRIGFAPKRVSVLVVADTVVAVTVDVAMADKMAEMEPVFVSATRTERLVEKTP